MQKQLTIENIDYNLFFVSKNKEPEAWVLEEGYFYGSDITTAYAYLVKKSNVPSFIKKINDFIAKCESLNIDSSDLEYLESLNDIVFLYKEIQDSEYDLFFTDFDMNMCQEESYIHIKEYEKFVEEIENLSTLAVYGGASINDSNIYDFALACLFENHAQEVVKIYSDNGCKFYKEDRAKFNDFHIINQTKDNKVFFTFIKLYFANIPNDNEDQLSKSINELIFSI